jgi:uncharacterized RDD family membrane protein YckC
LDRPYQDSPRQAPAHGTLDEAMLGSGQEKPKISLQNYPYLSTRIKSAFIDQMLILFALMILMIVTQSLANSAAIKIIAAALLLLVYEPVLTTYSATVGQRIMGIRVRSRNNPAQRISLGQAVFRYITKILLGWLSFLTIHANAERRAVHDIVSGSLVVDNSEIPAVTSH